MPEIVGTAYVRIRAITTQLADDIRDGMDKGASDAERDFGESGERAGAEFGDRAGESIREHSAAGADEAGRNAGNRFGEGFNDGTTDRIRADLPGDLQAATSEAVQETDVDHDTDALGARINKGIRDGMRDDEDLIELDIDEHVQESFQGNVGKTLKLFKNKFAWITMLGVPVLGGAIKLASAYIGGLVAQIGYLATAAVGAGAAFAGAFVGVALAAVPLFLAFKAPTEAMEDFKERMGELGDAWLELGVQAQRGLLPALDDAATLLTRRLTPALEDYSYRIGIIAGDTALLAAEALSASENQGELSTVLAGSEAIMEDLGRVFVAFAEMLLPFLADTIPMATTLSELFARWAESFSDFIQKSHESGELSETLQTWWDRARLVGGVLKNIFDILWDILQVGGDAAEPMFKTLDKVVDRWERWSSSARGRNDIRDWFDEAIPVMRRVNRIIGDIIEKIFGPTLEGDFGGVNRFLDFLEFDVIPLVETIIDTFSDPAYATALQDFADALVELLTAAEESGATGGFIRGVTKGLELLTTVLTDPTVGPAIANLLAWTAAWKGFNLVMLGVPRRVVRGVATGLANMARTLFQTGGAGAAQGTIGGWIGNLIRSGVQAIPWPAVFSAGGASVAAGVTAAAAWLAGNLWLMFNGDKVNQVWEDAKGWLMDGLSGIFDGVEEWLRENTPLDPILDFFQNFDWSNIGDAIADGFATLLAFFGFAPGAVNGILVGDLDAVVDGIYDWVVGLPDQIRSWWEGGDSPIDAFFEWILSDQGETNLNSWLENLRTWANKLPERISRWFRSLPRVFTRWINQAGKTTRTGLSDRITQLRTWAENLPYRIGHWLGRTARAFVEWIQDAAANVREELAKRAEQFRNWATDLPDRIENWLNQSGAAFTKWIRDARERVKEELAERWEQIKTWATGLWEDIERWLNTAPAAFVQWVKDAADDLATELDERASQLQLWFEALPVRFGIWVRNLPGALASIGSSIIDGIVQGLEDGAYRLGNWIENAVADFIRGVRDGFGSESPAKTMVPIGESIVDGLLVGLDNNRDALLSRASGFGDNVAAAMSGQANLRLGVRGLKTPSLSGVSAGSAAINLVVTIGERDITDIVDSRVSQSNMNMARAIRVRR